MKALFTFLSLYFMVTGITATAKPDINWVVYYSDDIIYKFQDTTGWGNWIPKFIAAHDSVYVIINRVFHANLPEKLVFVVWSDTALARSILNRPVGFAQPKKYTCNVYRRQTVGHEITHVLAYWGWGEAPKNQTRFITEGIAVTFNMRADYKFVEARTALEGKGYSSVLKIWKHDEDADEDILYPVAGAFVTYLYNNSTPEQFKQVVKKQTINDVRKIYGSDAFEKLIADFDILVGLNGR